MTPRPLPHTPEVVSAAQWLAEQDQPPAPIVPTLVERFNLHARHAAEAIDLAGRMRLLRRAFS